MSSVILTVVSILGLLLAGGVWIFVALIATAATTLAIFKDLPIYRVLSNIVWNSATSPELLALPLFILMAEILYRTRISNALFEGLAPWTERLPGRLLHVNILGCTMFAAICGSSAATAATVGRITLSELFARGYPRSVAIGSLAGAGTLGFLIPPSIIMIIYGVLSETSILKLFIAGIIPGVGLAFAYMLVTGARALIDPDTIPRAEQGTSWAARLHGLRLLLPVALLILAVIGSMYRGLASPTEAAVIGVFGALVVSVVQRCLTWENMRAAFLAAVRTSCMMGTILIGGLFLSVAMGYLGIPQFVAREIGALQLQPIMLVFLLMSFYIVLGCFLDGTSTIVMTLPITLPLISLAGYDKIWFGIFLVLVVEMAQITPPIGFNLFVIQGFTGEPLARIAWYALPYFTITLVFTVLLAFVPEIATFLPDQVDFRR
jgi:tripartite ATP-independent transporter DctM subunit